MKKLTLVVFETLFEKTGYSSIVRTLENIQTNNKLNIKFVGKNIYDVNCHNMTPEYYHVNVEKILLEKDVFILLPQPFHVNEEAFKFYISLLQYFQNKCIILSGTDVSKQITEFLDAKWNIEDDYNVRKSNIIFIYHCVPSKLFKLASCLSRDGYSVNAAIDYEMANNIRKLYKSGKYDFIISGIYDLSYAENTSLLGLPILIFIDSRNFSTTDVIVKVKELFEKGISSFVYNNYDDGSYYKIYDEIISKFSSFKEE